MRSLSSIAKTIANINSVVFHPVWMVAASIAILLFGTGSFVLMPLRAKFFILTATAVGTILLPLGLVSLYSLFSNSWNIEMPDRNDRVFPLITSAILYFYTWHYLSKLGLTGVIPNFLFGALLTISLVSIINFKWKISLHMSAIGGLIAMLFTMIFFYQYYSIVFLCISLLLAGLIGTSRLILDEHTPFQLYSGFVLGFISVFTSMFYIQ